MLFIPPLIWVHRHSRQNTTSQPTKFLIEITVMKQRNSTTKNPVIAVKNIQQLTTKPTICQTIKRMNTFLTETNTMQLIRKKSGKKKKVLKDS